MKGYVKPSSFKRWGLGLRVYVKLSGFKRWGFRIQVLRPRVYVKLSGLKRWGLGFRCKGYDVTLSGFKR